MNRNRSLLLIGLMLVLTACRSAGTPTVDDGASSPPAASTTPPSSSEPPASEAASSAPRPTAEAIPSDELGAFSCELPIMEAATAFGITNYTDVRVGTHDGYDRLVIEFTDGTPALTLQDDEPPYEQDASGLPLDVEGERVLRLTLPNGTAAGQGEQPTYDGPLNFDPGFPVLVDVVHGGDFEAQTTWFIGLAEESCVRVMLLTDPDRIVIDVEH
jgi:hypothetical protein